jgi:outer membrane murein-binding lipoprotein Lpp
MHLRKFVLSSVIAALLLSGCASGPQTTSTPQDLSGSGAAEQKRLRKEIDSLNSVVERMSGDLRQSRERAAEAELSRLEIEQQLTILQGHYEDLKRAHNESVNEVVRAQAKLRGSVSQADAASNIAEAEIALDAMAAIDGTETQRATELLQQAEQEFDAENYGGALYLSSQTKRLVSNIRSQQENRGHLEPVAGEVTYASPLPLLVSQNSNVRSGPGLSHPIVRTIKSGTAVDGYSYNGTWVRVRMEDGADGWVYRSLLAARKVE